MEYVGKTTSITCWPGLGPSSCIILALKMFKSRYDTWSNFWGKVGDIGKNVAIGSWALSRYWPSPGVLGLPGSPKCRRSRKPGAAPRPPRAACGRRRVGGRLAAAAAPLPVPRRRRPGAQALVPGTLRTVRRRRGVRPLRSSRQTSRPAAPAAPGGERGVGAPRYHKP